MIIIKNLLLIFVFISSVNSFSQTIEDLEFSEFIEVIDSLKQNENYLEAWHIRYEYVMFSNRNFNKQMHIRFKEIDEELHVLITTKVSKEEQINYYRNKADVLILKHLYKKAIYALMPLQYIDSTLNIQKEILDLTLKLPTDTVRIYNGHVLQLFSKESIGTSYSKNAVYYLISDSSLFSGVLIHKVYTSYNGVVVLNYENYTDGKISSSKAESYQRSYTYHENNVHEYQDSSQFWLFSSQVITNDTSIIVQYFNNGAIRKKTQGYHHGVYSCQLNIIFDEKGDTTSFSIYNYKNNNDGTSNSHTLNQYQDTVSVGVSREYYNNDDYITYEHLLNNNGDTISLLQTVNGLIDGLYIEEVKSDNNSFFKRTLWDNGTIIDIQIENAIFVNEKNKVISKFQFIELINNDEYPDYEIYTLLTVSSDIEKNGYRYLVSVYWIPDEKLSKVFKQRRKMDKKNKEG